MDRKTLVYKGVNPHICCCDATLRILPSGEFIIVFMTGGQSEPERGNHIRICRSCDQGSTWSSPEIVWKFPQRACTLTEVTVTEEKLTLYGIDWDCDGWNTWTMQSNDAGKTWSSPEPLSPYPHYTFIRNRIILHDGAWLLPVQTYLSKERHYETLMDMIREALKSPRNGAIRSRDGGKSWEKSTLVAGAKVWAENNLVELSDNTIAMLIRSDGDGCLLRSDSRDGGMSWTTPYRTEIPNPGSKIRLFKLSDGRIALLHNPSARERNPLALWISKDDLRTWSVQRVLTDFPGNHQYPDGVVDDREEFIHFAFDYNRHDLIYWGAELPK